LLGGENDEHFGQSVIRVENYSTNILLAVGDPYDDEAGTDR